MGNVLVGATGAFCNASARDQVASFFATHKVPDTDTELKHSIERINGCIELRDLQGPQLKSWLQTHSQSSAGETAH
jgi:aminopeptidase N/puromycin-sensitive aminopeptidase